MSFVACVSPPLIVTADSTSQHADDTLRSPTPSLAPPKIDHTCGGESFFSPRTLFKDVFFDFDSDVLRGDQLQNLQLSVTSLAEYPNVHVLLEGHCDERGTSQYNLALGERRANAVRSYLLRSGVASGRLETVSYGKERPFSDGDSDEAHQANRRVHFVVSAR